MEGLGGGAGGRGEPPGGLQMSKSRIKDWTKETIDKIKDGIKDWTKETIEQRKLKKTKDSL